MPYIYKYPRHQVTVDCLLYCKTSHSVLLIKRGGNPFKNLWAIPGGFVDPSEDLMTAAMRELEEETSIKLSSIHQFRTYGTPGRDPRGRNITIVYTALCNKELKAKGGDDADEAEWFEVNTLPPLAFDHLKIINDVVNSYSTGSSSKC